jgi:hypothetical protein
MHRPNSASAENGRQSKGPKTKEGKERSRRNAIIHSLCAKKIFLLPNESEEGFNEDFHSFIATFKPSSEVEFNFVSEMAGSSWLMCRARGMEKALFLDAQRDSNSGDRSAMTAVLDNPRFHNVQLYYSRLERSFDRSLNRLIKIREKFEAPECDAEFESATLSTAEESLPTDPPPDAAQTANEPQEQPEPVSESPVPPARPVPFVLPPWNPVEAMMPAHPPQQQLTGLPPGSYVAGYLNKRT